MRKSSIRRWTACACFSWVFVNVVIGGLSATNAFAQSCPVPSGASPRLSSVDAQVRIDYLAGEMKVNAHHMRIWAWNWVGIYSAISVGQFASIPLRSHDGRIDALYAGGASVVGVLPFILNPQPVMRDQRFVERALARGEHGCGLLAEIERRAIRDARSQKFGKGPIVHFGAFLFNLGVGGLLGFKYQHWDSALLQILVGQIVAETQIFTQPAEMIEVVERYRSADLTPMRRRKWILAPTTQGAMFAAEF